MTPVTQQMARSIPTGCFLFNIATAMTRLRIRNKTPNATLCSKT